MKKNILNIIIILLGNFILVCGVGLFILPFNILSGGVAGVAVALGPILNIDRELLINGVIVGFFILGWVILGKGFAAKTVLSSIAYPIFLTIVGPYLPKLDLDPFIASIYGGLVCGAGIGLVMRCGASTGGMDIPPMVLNKLLGFKISSCVMVIDALTVILGIYAYNIEAVLIGLFSVFMTGIAIDKVLSFGGESSKSVWIISSQYRQIIDEIGRVLDRGTTITEGRGGYTNVSKPVVLCVVSSNQYPQLIDIIHKYDEKAFVFATDATDVRGEGFSFGFKV
ncbi:MAG: YitT family protein [Erysipelotrichaceae bacterium]|nr:YitT family protein [Erysipelotrichaceae bacterium]MDY5251904.1 YitT family protein [Erysipelotrichaceae bacterium]